VKHPHLRGAAATPIEVKDKEFFVFEVAIGFSCSHLSIDHEGYPKSMAQLKRCPKEINCLHLPHSENLLFAKLNL